MNRPEHSSLLASPSPEVLRPHDALHAQLRDLLDSAGSSPQANS